MFNQEEYKTLLLKAIGDRNLSDFSEESTVNRTYISKYVNCRLEKPPSPAIIKRIAEYAHNGVTYEDLMYACGHTRSNNVLPVAKENEEICSLQNDLAEISKSMGYDIVNSFISFLKEESVDYECKEFVMNQENLKYIEFARKMKEKGVNPDDVTGLSLKYE